MFLFPAFGTFAADILVIYLYIKFQNVLETDDFWTIRNTAYLPPLSLFRLLLLIPYNYHTYSGTRLKFQPFYSILHAISAIIVLTHFFAFLLSTQQTEIRTEDEFKSHDLQGSYNNTSFADDENSLKNEQFDEMIEHNLQSNTVLEYDLIWILLTLSLVSISLHIVILLHVRSSAPSNDVLRRKFEEGQQQQSSSFWGGGGRNNTSSNIPKRKMLAYWVYDRYRRENDVGEYDDLDDEGANMLFQNNKNLIHQLSSVPSEDKHPKFRLEKDLSLSDDGDVSLSSDGIELSESSDDYFDTEEKHEEMDPLVLAYRNETRPNDHMIADRISYDDDQLNYFPAVEDVEQAMGSHYNEKKKSSPRRRRKTISRQESSSSWRSRALVDFHACFSKRGYDDFLTEIRSRFKEAKREWDTRLEEVTQRIQQNENRTNAGSLLLQLNQHTPFRALLHLYAHEDVFLNHKLDRAFSLQNQSALSFYAPQLLCFLIHNAYLSTGRLEKWILEKCKSNAQFAHRCFWFLRAWCLQGGIYRPEDDILHLCEKTSSDDDFKNSQKKRKSDAIENEMSLPLSRNGSSHNCSLPPSRTGSTNSFAEIGRLVKQPSEQDLKKTNGIKLSQEERTSLERLLAKVMNCGEIAARKLEFGPGDDDAEVDAQPLESSPLHLGDDAFIHPNGGIPTMRHLNSASSNNAYGFLPKSQSSTRLNNDGFEAQTYFLRTPDFLDSLMAIADDLLSEPRSNRTPALRRRLQQLEAKMLPSNSIYVPVNKCLHRVWRIVSSESIALSTKERVPCIIYLEVIDHKSNSKYLNSEDEILSSWYKSSRPPQRHNTILAKVTLGLKKLRHDLEERNEKLFGVGERDSDHSQHDTLPYDNVVSSGEENYITTVSNSSVANNENGATQKFATAKKSTGNCEPNQSFSLEQNDFYPNLNHSLPPSTSSSRCASPATNLGQWLNSIDSNLSDSDSDSESSDVEEIVQEVRQQKPPRAPRDNKKTLAYGSTKALSPDVENQTLDLRDSTPVSSSSPRVVFKEDWNTKQKRIRENSAYGKHPDWRLLPILIKTNDDLRQEQLAAQLIHCIASILARAKVPVWLYPYEIVALSFRGGVMEAIPDTISIDSLRKNHPHFTDLKAFFEEHFGSAGSDTYENAKASFVESLAAYSIVCFLLQIKDRHNGNILLDNKGHLVHIDFGFYFLSSPGKNSGFESAPFKLTWDFVNLMDGANSHTFKTFRELCYRTFLELRRNCFQITLLVQMLMEGNEDLDCFRGRPHAAVEGLQERFRLDLNDRACAEYVNSLINDSLENWTTTWYDRYQRCCVGIM